MISDAQKKTITKTIEDGNKETPKVVPAMDKIDFSLIEAYILRNNIASFDKEFYTMENSAAFQVKGLIGD